MREYATLIGIYFNMEKQQLILVDENDRPTGKYAEKSLCHKGKGLHHRAFVLVIYNKQGEILLQKRKHQLWDGYWDISATTHVLHLPKRNETYEEAAKRCLERELGIEVNDLKNIGGFNYYAKEKSFCENEYCAILVGQYDGEIKANKDVLYAFVWEPYYSVFQRIGEFTPWANITFSDLAKQRFFESEIQKEKPLHIAFIMDGNRRWARQKGLPTFIGHEKGYRRMETVVDHAIKNNIPFITFWAFSTENWNRDKKEVDFLMKIFRRLFKNSFVKKLLKNGVKLETLGELDPFPKDIVENIEKLKKESKNNTAIIVNIALNYGGRAEILRAAKMIDQNNIDEQSFANYLYTKGQPDPDLIVRTGGDMRLSGFLPWQAVYSELYFTQAYWPEFDEKEFDKALEEYARRQRRFGK